MMKVRFSASAAVPKTGNSRTATERASADRMRWLAVFFDRRQFARKTLRFC
jgi:hypothetical protein